MGLEDRDYSRESWAGGGGWGAGSSWGGAGSSWGGAASLSVTVKLIIINAVIFLADTGLSDQQPRHFEAMPVGAEAGGQDAQLSFMTRWFAVSGETIANPLGWYRFLTYGFVHDNQTIWHVGFNMLALFFFGRAVEARLGSREFLRYYLVAILLGGLVGALRWAIPALASGAALPAIPIVGASGAVAAVLILFAIYYPQATILLMFVFPVKAWLVAVLFVVGDFFGMLGDGRVAHEVHLAGAAWAGLYHLKRWRLAEVPLPQLGALAGLLRRRPNLRLHDPDKKLARQEQAVDRILDKIQQSGIDSLTPSERRTLEKHSRIKRQQRP